MAGDWIKMRSNLWDDPRVTGICDLTDQKEATIVGALYWLWSTADQHSEDGVMPGLSLRQIDRKTEVPGLGDALVSIGWLILVEGGVQIARFNEHNGASAKSRMEVARRVSKHRAAKVDEEAGEYKRLSIPRPLRDAVLRRDGHSCVYCGRSGGSLGPMDTKADGYLHLEHVIPRSRGGTDEESNLAASCRACNMRKGDRTPEEAGMPWPTFNGKRLGNAYALQNEDESDTGALARGRGREREEINTTNQPARARAENDQFPMTPDWRPGETFSSIAKPAGLIPPTGADWDAALAEFVSYWLSKPGEQRTQSEWEHALVRSLKHSKGAARGGRSPPGQQPSRKETQLFTAALMTGTAGTQGQQPTTTEIIDADPSPSAPRLVG